MVPKPHVFDVVDMGDPTGAYWADNLDGHNTATIGIGRMSNAIEQMVDMVIRAASGKPDSVRCLALWGHGLVDKDHSPLGVHVVSGGWDGQYERSALTNATVLTLHHSLIRLAPLFQGSARVELRGCGVAGTDAGVEVMKMLASRWNVRVHGAQKNQPLMAWLPPVVEVTPTGAVNTVAGIDYNDRT